MAGYQRLLDLTGDLPVENRALAMFRRGVWGDTDKEITDYTAVLDMPATPADLVAKAREGLTRSQAKKASF